LTSLCLFLVLILPFSLLASAQNLQTQRWMCGPFQVMAGVNEFDVGEAMPSSHWVAMAFDL
jgi:hypothetical protein